MKQKYEIPFWSEWYEVFGIERPEKVKQLLIKQTISIANEKNFDEKQKNS